MKILLVKASNSMESGGNYRKKIPLGLCYISAYLKEHGYDVTLVDGSVQDLGNKYIVDEILKENYDIIGFTVIFRKMMSPILDIVTKVREAGCMSHITIGGHYPSFDYEYILCNYPCIDSVMRFEGEIAFYQLVKCIEEGGELKKVPNIALRVGSEIFANPEICYENDLDKIPFPDRSAFIGKLKQTDIMNLVSARGCYGNCTFCSIAPFYRTEGCTWRGRSPQNLVDEIYELYEKYGSNQFDFVDDNIFGPGHLGYTRLLDFCNELDKRNLKITFSGSARVNDGDRELYKLLYEHGLIRMMYGVEAGNPNSLARYNKGVAVEKNYEALKMVYEVGIIPELGYIFFEPFLSLEEAQANLNFLDQVEEYVIISVETVYNRLDVLSGSAMETTMKQAGLISRENFDFSNGYLYNFVDKRIALLWDAVEEFRTAVCKTNLIAVVELQGLWMELETAKHIRGERISEYLQTLHRVRRLQNRNILDNFHIILKTIEDGDGFPQDLMKKLSERQHDYDCRVISFTKMLRAQLRERAVIEVNSGEKEGAIKFTSIFD